MLRIRIDGQDVEMTPALLAKLVFDGKVDQHSPARVPGATAEQPLEQSLGLPHCEALTAELHRRLQMMCSMDATAVDLQELCTRVEGLCRWRWANAPVAARFFWVAGWLNELADRTKNAVEFYDAFLLMPSADSHLRLLALNNRGVLRIQLGRLEGVHDLARAAISDCGLPAACFNLLNLINVSFAAADLLRTVDEELADYFSRLPEDLRALWLGPPSAPAPRDLREGSPGSPPGDAAREISAGSAGRDLLILRDPTCRRLNMLVTRLSARARGLAPESRHPLGHASVAFRQLALWDCRLSGDRPGREVAAYNADHLAPDPHQRSAEAASLLLSDDVPSVLARPENPLGRMEQSVREELAGIEECMASGQYEPAKSRLHVQRKVLRSVNVPGGLAAVLARVDAQLERVAALEAQEEQLRFQQSCARLAAQVQEFCTLAEVHQAQNALADLQRRLQQFQAESSPQNRTEAAGLVEELGSRLLRHLDGLRQVQIEALVREPWEHLRQNRPSAQTAAVPESVYQALAQCRRHDPQGSIEDWAALQEQLDAHQAQYHAHRALSALQSGPGSWDQVQGDLAEALRHDPSSWLTVSSLFGWGGDEGGQKDPHGPERPAATGQPPFTAEQAGLLLGKVLRQYGADARKCLLLWRQVETTLSPALAGPDAEALAGARLLAEKCLDSWPAGSPQAPGRADPRHPVNRFLEACDKARCLVEAERLLEARPPRWEEAKRHLAGILQSGVDTRDQLRRIVTGFYLAQCREKDAPSVQRQVLADLEAWAQALPQEAVLQMRGREIVEETEKVRVAVAGRSESGLCQARPDEPAAKEKGRGLLAKSWGGRHRRPTQDETENARKEA